MKNQVVRKIVLMVVAVMMAMVNAQAQDNDLFPRRMDCTRHLGEEKETRSDNYYTIPYPIKDWDASRVYRQLVVLVEFSDSTFSYKNPSEYYDRLFNEEGYNEGYGPGCVADYFREQSGGLLNLQFDIVGPCRVDETAKSSTSFNYGDDAIKQAFSILFAERPDMDYKPYDWNDDGEVEQVVVVFASYTGNMSEGFIWPNTGYAGYYTTPDGLTISNVSASCELWEKQHGCGIGTICHEYCHSLGLPDIYPTRNSSGYSVCDEFDLMDGGNYTNWGWCPPNFSAMEKMFLGWLTPVELDATTTISGMSSVSDGGTTYIIPHTDSEYLLMENRQRKGWDAGIPGCGLVIFHIDYDESSWLGNNVNNRVSHHRYDIVHADNLNYDDWDKLYPHTKKEQYLDVEKMLYNRHLSTSPYPWYDSATDTENDCLTDTSVPNMEMFNANAEGSKQFGKSITNIRVADDGTVSFDFTMETTGISEALLQVSSNKFQVTSESWYTIDGRRLAGKPTQPGFYLHQGKKRLKIKD